MSRKLGEEMAALVRKIKDTVEANAENEIESVHSNNAIIVGRLFLYLSGFLTGVSCVYE